MPGPPRGADAFGSGLASGDFDRDGRVDLADRGARPQTAYRCSSARRAGSPEAPPQRGSRALATRATATVHRARPRRRRLRRPDRRRARRRPAGAGAVHLLLRRAGGLQAARARRVLEPPVRRDRRLRHAAAAAATSTATTTSTSWKAARRALRRRATRRSARASARPAPLPRVRARAAAPRAFAVADVNDDGYADIVQGDSRGTTQPLAAGEVRLWLGSRRGPRATPIRITQNTPAIPGMDEPGDQFGAVVEAGDVDSRRLRRHDRRRDRRERGRRADHGRSAAARRLRERRQHLLRPELADVPGAAGRRWVRVDARDAEPHLRPPARPRRRGARRAPRRRRA